MSNLDRLNSEDHAVLSMVLKTEKARRNYAAAIALETGECMSQVFDKLTEWEKSHRAMSLYLKSQGNISSH